MSGEKVFRIKWQQHDEDGNYSRVREEDFYAESLEEAWKEAFCEGEHPSDYLISAEVIEQ